MFSYSFVWFFIPLISDYQLRVTNLPVMVQRWEIISWAIDLHTEKEESLPSNSLRVLLAISLISIRDKDSDWVTGREATPLEVVVVMTLGAKGDFRGRSMLRPTRLLRGILYRFLHGTSPSTQNDEKNVTLPQQNRCLILPNEKLHPSCWMLFNPNNKDLSCPRYPPI